MLQKENLDNYDKAYDSVFKYNDENSFFLSYYGNYIADSIKQNNLKTVLSLGIGHHIVTDVLSNTLNQNTEEYTILEGSKSIIDKFKIKEEHTNKINLVLTYFEDFETDKKFDCIEMGFVLEHVDNPALIVEKFKHFLSEKGKMFIAVPNAQSLHRRIGFESGMLDDIYKLSEYDYQLGHKRYFDLEKISYLVEQTGLKINNKVGLFLKPITTVQMQQLEWNENIMKALLQIGKEYPELCNCILLESSW